MKQKLVLFFMGLTVSAILLSVTTVGDIGAANTIWIFDKNAAMFVSSVTNLYTAVKDINQDTMSIRRAKDLLKICRTRYKSISFFTSYFFPSETKMYNAPPKYEVEEPELELEEPMGLQQLEVLLFDGDILAHKNELIAQTDALYTSAKDLRTLLYQFKANDSQVLESVRIELIRIITLYISGYDAPLLKTGIEETLETSRTIQEVLKPYFKHSPNNSVVLAQILRNSIKYLDSHQQFDSFNRMEYLVNYALPLQEQLNLFIKIQHLELNTSAYLNYGAPNLFSPGFLKNWDSIPPPRKRQMAALGKSLFFDKMLSGNLKISCSSCHQPQKYFTDGKIKSPSLVADSVLKRNTPTLLYSGLQHAQFWDGRAKNLVEQIKDVVFNPLEMGAKKELLYKNIMQSPRYKKAFKTLFAKQKKDGEYLNDIALSISAFVTSLNPMNSAFDQYVRGNKGTMTSAQVKGFNLFMGKAQCGTCHFAPYFNSLTPPLYDASELEILGTPKTDNLEAPEYDRDMGRYDLYQIRFYKQAFKTPTVRNTQNTGPYMHNGAFRTLDGVLDFYNKGGGNGLGLNIAEQTLPSKPLNLSKQEVNDIIQFLNSLTDKPYIANKQIHLHKKIKNQ